MLEVDWELLQFSNEYLKAQSVSLKISCLYKYAIKDYAIKDKPMRKHCKKTLDHKLFQKTLDHKLLRKV
jgi:hypothetical protein